MKKVYGGNKKCTQILIYYRPEKQLAMFDNGPFWPAQKTVPISGHCPKTACYKKKLSKKGA